MTSAPDRTSEKPVVLITGCSSGIGREAARRFARAGFRVYASMRRPEQGAALLAEAAASGWFVRTPALDVTSDASVDAAVGELLRETGGRIDVLVNNAGYYLFGPIEQTSPDELRAQFETNLFGVLRVTRAVLPAMRARQDGAVVNLSSLSGLLVIPVAGPYHASKFALEAMTEALRYELIPFGIRVCAVEPGPFKTDLHAKEVEARAAARPDSPYRGLIDLYQHKARSLPRADLDEVVEVIFRAATARRPPLRWPVGPNAFTGGRLKRFVPDAIFELVTRIVFRLRGPRR